MKIERMKKQDFKDSTSQTIGGLINDYISQIKCYDEHPIDFERHYTHDELCQLAALLGTSARAFIAIRRSKEKSILNDRKI